jgi:hypothetical protein
MGVTIAVPTPLKIGLVIFLHPPRKLKKGIAPSGNYPYKAKPLAGIPRQNISQIALRISATATELLFPAARSALCREPSSASTPFPQLRLGKGEKRRGTDDAMHLYRYQYINI